MRRAERFALVLLLVLLTGCAAVPTSGPVVHYQPAQPAASNGVQVAPLPPVDGATQLLIVEGFLHAMSTNDGDYRVARQYLTTEAAGRWRPESGVQVYADGYPPTETDQSVVLTAPLTGTIDASGAYHAATGQLRLDFGLVKDDNGQWRISNPPNGVVVSRYLFTDAFQAVNLNFLSSSGDVLLPDPRYYPSGTDEVRLVAEGVLRGPSAWLQPLTTQRSTRDITVSSVSIDSGGIAKVQLSPNALQLSRERRDAILAELVFTLSGLDQVVTVQVSASGELWAAKSGRWDLNQSNYSDLDPADSVTPRPAYLARDGKLQRQATQAGWSDYVDLQTDLPKVGNLAISRNAQQWAALTDGDGRLLVGTIGQKGSKVQRSATGLLRPSFDRSGQLWSPAGTLSALAVFREGAAVPVTVRGLPAGRVVALSLAPDGVRAAVVLANAGRTEVGLVRVHRSESGVLLDGWQPVDLSLAGASTSKLLDVGWNSVTELALLRVDTDQQTSVLVVSQDSAEQTDTGPSDARGLVALAAAPSRPPLASSVAGDVYRFDGEFDWLVSISGVSAVAYPG